MQKQVHGVQEAKAAEAAAAKAQEEEQRQRAAEAARQQEELAESQRAMEQQKARDVAQLEARLVSLHSQLMCDLPCCLHKQCTASAQVSVDDQHCAAQLSTA